MTAHILDGRHLAAEITAELEMEIAELGRRGTVPHLVAVSVGNNASSEAYLRRQKRGAEAIGISYSQSRLPEGVSEEDLLVEIERLNGDAGVTGVILQRPLPPGMDGRRIQCALSIDKDVEGLTPTNLGLLYFGRHVVAPSTALAVVELLRRSGVDLKGKEVTVVGASDIVGKPLAILLTAALATVSLCHIETVDVTAYTRRAEVLVAAVGKPGLITADMVRPGAVVVDVGYSRVPDPDRPGKTRAMGDVDFEAVHEVAGAITPVPGGIGPMTVAMLLANTVRCAKRLKNRN